MTFAVHNEDCLTGMANLAENSIDAIVTDPPYGLSFMGKGWDHGVPGSPFWQAALRIAKPGAHLLAFGGTRTYHRLTCAIEDAGWEIRDCLMWVYGSGFPKSLDVSKAIDKAAGAKREIVGSRLSAYGTDTRTGDRVSRSDGGAGYWVGSESKIVPLTGSPSTDAARQWSGWGTALKPSYEPIILARKPLIGTVAANVQEFGTGAMNIDGCRIGNQPRDVMTRTNTIVAASSMSGKSTGATTTGETTTLGRWPANLIHDGSDEVLELFPQTAKSTGGNSGVRGNAVFGKYGESQAGVDPGFGDQGSAARFFYCAKASKADRNEGCDLLEERAATKQFNEGMEGKVRSNGTVIKPAIQHRNNHPTVKPTALMRYLCRLVTPPGGLVCDPFTGSGSTGKAALLEGFRFIGFELEAEYAAIARARCAGVLGKQPLLEAV